MDSSKSAQAIIAPLATLLTTFLWLETWLEILSRGAYHSPDDLSKLYLAAIAAYSGAAEINKWLVNEPTDPTQDPRFERIQRGGFFVWLWLAPLLFAYGWRITNPAIPMSEPIKKIAMGLIGIFFLKAASRKWRHKEHGVIGSDAERVESEGANTPDVTGMVYSHLLAAPNGLTAAECLRTIPKIQKTAFYRAVEKLLDAHRIRRVGKPHRKDVRYMAIPDSQTAKVSRG